MIGAVILSAGESSRMGRPKALLPIDGQTFIERIVGALKHTKVGKVIVILGHNADEMRRRIEHLPVEILLNPDYKLGQLSSLQVAVRRLETADGLRRHACPSRRSSLHRPQASGDYDRALLRKRQTLVVPRHGGKRGHPVIFSRKLFEELLAAPMDQGAKAVVNAHRDDTLEIDTDDKGITVDIDTPELYKQHVKGE